jgi:hypothetical protein
MFDDKADETQLQRDHRDINMVRRIWLLITLALMACGLNLTFIWTNPGAPLDRNIDYSILRDRDIIYQNRSQLVAKTCAKYNLSNGTVDKDVFTGNLLINHDHKVKSYMVVFPLHNIGSSMDFSHSFPAGLLSQCQNRIQHLDA